MSLTKDSERRDSSLAKKVNAVSLLLKGYSVSRAISQTGLSRATIYRALRRFRAGGVEGLKYPSHTRPRPTNCLPEQVVRAVIELTRRFPTFSYPRLAQRARQLGFRVSNSGVQKIWARMELTDRESRLKWAGRLENREGEG